MRKLSRYLKNLSNKKKQVVPFFIGALVILLPLFYLSLRNIGKVEAAWWNGGETKYQNRKQLTLVNDSGEDLATDTTISISVDIQELLSQGSLQDDCDDLRVIYQPNSTTATELKTHVTFPNGGICSTSTIAKLSFNLQAALTDTSETNTYYVYYNSQGASAQTSQIDAYDIDNANALLVCPFDGDTDCINGDGLEQPTTETGAIRYGGAKTALLLDGDGDVVNVSNDPSIQDLHNGSFTAEGWFNLVKPDSSQTWATLIEKSNWSDSGWGLITNMDGRTLQFKAWFSGTDISLDTSALVYEFDTWNHFAVSYNNETRKAKIYVNGIEKAESSASTGIGSTDSAQSLAISDSSSSSSISGRVDEVRISNIARYTSNFTPQNSPFVRDDYTKLLLHFDEGGDQPYASGCTSGQACDDSGNGNHGTITGAKYVAGLVGVDNGTSDAGQQYNQSFASHEGIFLEEGTTNLIKNPSFDHATFNTLWSDEEDDSTVFNLSTSSATFTPNMAKRGAPGPFTAAPIIQGNSDSSTADSLTASANKISTDFYDILDRNQGSIVFWITPEWDGDDTNVHRIIEQEYYTRVFANNGNLYLMLHSSEYYSIDISSWQAGSTYLVVARWDEDNPMDGTNYMSISVDNSHNFGRTSPMTYNSSNNPIRIGSYGDDNNPANAIIEGLTVYRRPLFDGQYGVDVGNGDEIEQIYGGGTSPQDPTLITGSWDVVFALPTNSSTGTLSTGTGEAWSHPHSSNLLPGNSNAGGFMLDGSYPSDGWLLEGTPTAVAALATGEKIFAGGYKTTSDAADEGIYDEIAVTSGDDFVVRGLVNSDGTCAPSLLITGADDGEITHLDGTTSSTRTDPDVLLFTFEADATENIKVKLINTASSGTCYWHQVEVLDNMVSNPSFDDGFQGSNPDIPDDWSNADLDTDEGFEETTIVHSGNSSFGINTDDILEGINFNPGRTVDKYYSFGNFMYETSNDIRIRINTSYSAHFANTVSYNVDSSGASWKHYPAIVRGISGGFDGIIPQSFFFLGSQGYFDDLYFFELDDVSLTVTPASEANSTEDGGLRVDGCDSLSQSITGLTTTAGDIRFRYIPRHDADNADDDFGISEPNIAAFRYDGNNRINLFWQDAGTGGIVLFYSMNGTNDTGYWDASGEIAAGNTYEMEIIYTGGGDMVLKVNDDPKITLSNIPSSFSTAPTTAYWGMDNSGSCDYNLIGDAVFTDPSTNPGSGNITDTEETSAPYYKFGSKSAKLVAGANDYYTIRSMVNVDTTYTLSAYVYDGTTGNIGGEVDNTIAQLVFEGSNISGTTYTDMGGGWWRLTYSASASQGGVQHFGVYTLNGKTIYVDGVQLEDTDGNNAAVSYATSFIDGSQGTGYSWTGNAHESTSSRNHASALYPGTGNIDCKQGSISFWLKKTVNFPNISEYYPRIFRSRDDAQGDQIITMLYGYRGQYIQLALQGYSSSWYSYDSTVSSSSWNPDEWHYIVGTWEEGGNAIIYVDGIQNVGDAISTLSNVCNTEGISLHGSDSLVSDFRIYDDVLTQAEVDDLYYSGLVSHSEGIEVERHDDSKGQAPVAVWHFDEMYGTVAYDSSMYGNDLTISNATPSGDLANNNPRARNFQFNGTDSYLYRNPSDTDLLFDDDSFSVSGWFRHPSSISGTDTIIAQYGYAATGDAGGWKVYMNSSGYVCVAIDDDSTWGPDDSACTTKSYADSSWYHFSFVKSSTSSITLYINGAIAASLDSLTATGSLNNNAPIYVGIDSDGSTNPWSGFLDEIVIYPYARSADQVKTDATSGPHQTAAVFGLQAEDWLTEGLVGYWKMNEDSWDGTSDEVIDSSGNDNHGTAMPSGSEPTTGIGKFGKGGVFDGTENYIQVADQGENSSLDVSAEITMSAWVKIDSSSSYGGIISKSGNGDFAYKLDLSLSGNNFRGYITSADDGMTSCSVTDPNTFSTGQWYHLTYTFKNSKGVLYKDGVQLGTCTGNYNIEASNYNLFIGSTNQFNQRLPGSIDEVRIYNRALSSVEVQKLYNWAPGPVAHYKFDEGGGSIAYDSSGNNLPLTLDPSSSFQNGKYGNALLSNGTNNNSGAYRTDTSNSPLDLTGDLSISFWVKANELPTDDAYILLSKGNTGTDKDNNYACWLQEWGSGPYISCSIGNGTTFYSASSLLSMSISADTWYHVELVNTYQNRYFYINGNLVDTDTNDITPLDNNSDFTVGGKAYDFPGYIDDVRVYNYARTPAQIIEDMNAGHPLVGSPVGSQIGYWKFDEGYGSTAHDSAPQGNDGTLGAGDSAPTWTADGKYGKALDFDGTNDYVDLGDLDYLDAAEEFTITTWVNIDTYRDDTFIIGKYLDPNNQIGIKLSNDNNGEGSDEIILTLGESGNSYAFSSEDIISTGQWHHLAMIYDGVGSSNSDKLKLFSDGIERTLSYVGGSMPSQTDDNSVTVKVGTSRAGSSNFIDGTIDEVKIYNTALTTEQVLLDYNQGKSTVMGATSTDSSGNSIRSDLGNFCVPGDSSTCNAPIVWYKFDENTGTSLYDSSGNGNTGNFGIGNSAPAWARGMFGGGLYFDGAGDYVQVSDNSNIQDIPNGSDFSVEAWLKTPESWSAWNPSQQGQVISKANFYGTPNGWALYNQYLGKPTFFVAYSNTDATARGSDLLENDTWYYLAGTIDNATKTPKLYVNSKEVDYAGTNGNQGSGDGTYDSDIGQDMYISWQNQKDTNQHIKGTIDEIRIYDYLRTPAQIAWSYNKGAPIAWWKLNECQGTTAYDSSVNANGESNGYNGTINIGGTAPNTSAGTCGGSSSEAWYNGDTGKRGASLDFDGVDDYIEVTTEFNTYDWEGITASAWFKPDVISSGRSLVSKWDNDDVYNGSSVFNLYHAGDQLCFMVSTQPSNSTGTACSGSGTIAIGTWYHALGTYDGSYVRIYLNGKLINSTAETQNLGNPSTNIFIGATYDASSGYNNEFNGQIDDVRIYNYPLTQEQIRTVMNSGAVVF